jgi:Ca2+/H+ antiporter
MSYLYFHLDCYHPAVQSVLQRYFSISSETNVGRTAVYGCYLLFQLGSHTKMYQDDSADIVKSTAYESRTPVDGETVQLQTIPILTEEPLEDGESPQLNGLVCMLLLGAVTAVRPGVTV